MKTMKSFMVMLLVAMVPMFFACEEGIDKDASVIGKWQLKTIEYEEYWEDGAESETEKFNSQEFVWEFTNNQELIITAFGNSEYFTYEIEGNLIYTEYAYYHSLYDYFTIISLSSKKLVLETRVGDKFEGDITTITLERIGEIEDNTSNDSDDTSNGNWIEKEWRCMGYDAQLEADGMIENYSEDWSSEYVVWYLNNNTLRIQWPDEEYETYDYRIDGNKLYSSYANNYGADYFTIIKINETTMDLEVVYDRGVRATYLYHFRSL